MNSRAKIGTLAKTDPALLVPYGGAKRAIGELQALGVALTPEDYRAIRESFGGGKRGRARARELVPLECPACEARLTHFDRSGREPYFAASAEGSSHGPHCYAAGATAGNDQVVAAAKDQTVTAPADEPSAQEHEPLLAGLHAEDPRASTGSDAVGAEELLSEELTAQDLVIDDLAAEELVAEGTVAEDGGDGSEASFLDGDAASALAAGETYYFVAGGADERALGELKSRLGIGTAAVLPTAPRGTELADARELLIQALNRAVPARCTINFRGQDHAVVADSDVHAYEDGAQLAVYGRFTEAEWHAASGRLVLKATPRTVQVWATSSVPRRLFQVASNREITTPVLNKPVPFLAFGTLKKLGPTCGMPVFRSDSLVLLQSLSLPARESRDTWVDAPAQQDGLTLLPTSSDLGRLTPTIEQFDYEPPADDDLDVPVARTVAPAPKVPALGSAWTTFDEEPGAHAEAHSDGLSLLVPAVERTPVSVATAPADTTAAGSSTVAPVAPPPTRGAFSTFRSLASSFRRSKSR
ncbi:MAG: hypothetical protein RLZZ450_922 [Pseudomonadota bacterium]|jgi:hypothetical protein